MSFTPEQLAHIDALINSKGSAAHAAHASNDHAETALVAGKKQNKLLAPTLAHQKDAPQFILKTKNTSTHHDEKDLWVKLSVEDEIQNKLTKAQNLFTFVAATSVVAVNGAKLVRNWEDDWDCNPDCDDECEPDYTAADHVHYYGKKGIKYSVIGLALAYYGKAVYSWAKDRKPVTVGATIDPNLATTCSD